MSGWQLGMRHGVVLTDDGVFVSGCTQQLLMISEVILTNFFCYTPAG
jgi:hypothetical protein